MTRRTSILIAVFVFAFVIVAALVRHAPAPSWLGGGAETFSGGAATFSERHRSAPGTSDRADVFVAFAADGERGDLPGLLTRRPDLGTRLATDLVPLLEAEVETWDDGLPDPYTAASYRIIGAGTDGDEIHLYAHESVECFAFDGGRLMDDFTASYGPVRIRLSPSLLPLAIDWPQGMGGDYLSSCEELLPKWALGPALLQNPDKQTLRRAAGRWVARTGRLPELRRLPRPGHADPHGHSPDVYTLGALPDEVHGLSVAEARPPTVRANDKLASSPDGRFACYMPDDEVLFVHDARLDRWLRIEGPGIYNADLADNFSWAGDVLVFDIVDVGFSMPRPMKMSKAHVEVDLGSARIARVVPLGPHTGNWRP